MNIPLFDGHCDTAFQMLLHGGGLLKNEGQNDLTRASAYSPYAQFFAVFAVDAALMPVDFPHLRGQSARDMYRPELDKLFSELEANSDRISLCRSAAEARAAAESGKAAAFISVEGAELLDCDIGELEAAYALGVRAVNLTWNIPNALSGTNAQEKERGLSDAGRRFVRRCGELGVIVDVSHLSDPGFWDVFETCRGPFIASHSNSRAVCGHSRNLGDAQFLALMSKGGVAGLNLYTEFLGENATVDTAVRHIEHFAGLGGAKNISIGGDLDGCETLPEGIGGIEDVYKLYEALLRMNYPESVLRDIFYNNLMRVVEEVCDI